MIRGHLVRAVLRRARLKARLCERSCCCLAERNFSTDSTPKPVRYEPSLKNRSQHGTFCEEDAKHAWDPDFATAERLPRHYWSDAARQRVYLDWLGKQLNVKQISDWYRVKQTEAQKFGAASIMYRHGNSLPNAIMAVYPEHTWRPWLFNQVPADFWKNFEHQQQFCHAYMEDHNMSSLSQWYKVKSDDIRAYGGSYLVGRLHNSLCGLLRAVYPQHDWLDWYFDREASGLWDSAATRKRFLDWFAAEHKISKQEDWYKVTNEVLKEEGATYLLKRYNFALHALLQDVYGHFWLPWLFKAPPRNFWLNIDNQRRYADWLAKKLEIKDDLVGWYRVGREEVIANYGRGVMVLHKGSVRQFVMNVYPNHKWVEWLFSRVENNFWDSMENQRRYFEWLHARLGFKSMEQWYDVTTETVYANYGSGLLAHRYGGSLMRALPIIFPEHRWDVARFRVTTVLDGTVSTSGWSVRKSRVPKAEETQNVNNQ